MDAKETLAALRLEGGLEISGKPLRVAQFLEGLSIAQQALEEKISMGNRYYVISRSRAEITAQYIKEYIGEFESFDTFQEAQEYHRRVCWDDECHGIFYMADNNEMLLITSCFYVG